jgi:hypothetical protein
MRSTDLVSVVIPFMLSKPKAWKCPEKDSTWRVVFTPDISIFHAVPEPDTTS